MNRTAVIREVDRLDRLINDLGNFIAYGTRASEELERALEGYDIPKEALDDLYERRQELTEMLSKNPDQEAFDV